MNKLIINCRSFCFPFNDRTKNKERIVVCKRHKPHSYPSEFLGMQIKVWQDEVFKALSVWYSDLFILYLTMHEEERKLERDEKLWKGLVRKMKDDEMHFVTDKIKEYWCILLGLLTEPKIKLI